MSVSSQPTNRGWAALIFYLAVGAYLILSAMMINTSPTVWQDEVEIAALTKDGLTGVPNMISVTIGDGTQNGVPAVISEYVNDATQSIFGLSPLSSRLPSVLASAAAAVVVFHVLRRLGVRLPIAAAAGVALLSDQLVAAGAHGGRADALGIALVAASGFLLLVAADGGRTRVAWASGAAAGLSVFVWPTAFVVALTVPALIPLADPQYRRHAVKSAAAGAAAVIVLIGASLLLPNPQQAIDDMRNALTSTVTSPVALVDVPKAWMKMYQRVPLFPLLVVAGWVLPVVFRWRRLWGLVIASVVAFAFAVRTEFYGGRLVYSVLSSILLVALATDGLLDRVGNRARRYAVVAVWAFAAVTFLVDPVVRAGTAVVQRDRRDYDDVRAFVIEAVRPGDVVFGAYPAYYAVIDDGAEFVGRFQASAAAETFTANDVGPGGELLDGSEDSSPFLRSVDVVIVDSRFGDLTRLTSADGGIVFNRTVIGDGAGPYALVAFRRVP